MQERKADQRLINEYRRWASSLGLDLESDDSRDSSSVSVSDGDDAPADIRFSDDDGVESTEKLAPEQVSRGG